MFDWFRDGWTLPSRDEDFIDEEPTFATSEEAQTYFLREKHDQAPPRNTFLGDLLSRIGL